MKNDGNVSRNVKWEMAGSEENTNTTSSTMADSKSISNEPRLIVIAPTFYSDTKDVRYALALESCKKASEHEIEFIFVDASPSQTIRDGLQEAGQGFVRVVPQTSKGKKGAALREGIQLAAEMLQDEMNNTGKRRRAIIGFQEPEKVDMIRHWKSIASYAVQRGSDIVVPRRRDQEFRATYPIEQYHSEQFANLFLDTLGSQIGLPSIDWTAGPIALDRSMANKWLEYEGEVWDAQLVPIIDCFLDKQAIVSSFEVPYCHPESMKEEEGGNPKFNDKRLHQLNFLSETVGQRIRDTIEKLGQ